MPDKPDTTVNNLHDDVPELPAAGPRAASEAELVRWLTAQIQTFPGCAQVTVEQLFRLEMPDAEGCNWSRTLVLDPHGVSPVEYVLAYATVVERARKACRLA